MKKKAEGIIMLLNPKCTCLLNSLCSQILASQKSIVEMEKVPKRMIKIIKDVSSV